MERVVETIQAAGKTVVIRSRSTAAQPRQSDWHLYRSRHLIGNFVARLKQRRAFATRWDKRATIFFGAIHLAATIAWSN
ncbi:transposase [bacterium]|nr:transposase [bacterium]